MRRSASLALLVVSFGASAPAADAARYVDPDVGVEVRVRAGRATITYPDPRCGIRISRPARIRNGRFSRREKATCSILLFENRASTVVVSGRAGRRVVRGAVGTLAFVARRPAPRATPAQRCGWRGIPIVANPFLRVFVENDRTIVCRRSDGLGVEIARTIWDENHYYALGVSARLLRAMGSRIAYVSAPIDSARSKYAQDPGYEDDVIVRNLANGAVTRGHADVYEVAALAMLEDGTVAWTGRHWWFSEDDVLVQRMRLGKVETLDRGPIDEHSLRVVDGAFVWDRR